MRIGTAAAASTRCGPIAQASPSRRSGSPGITRAMRGFESAVPNRMRFRSAMSCAETSAALRSMTSPRKCRRHSRMARAYSSLAQASTADAPSGIASGLTKTNGSMKASSIGPWSPGRFRSGAASCFESRAMVSSRRHPPSAATNTAAQRSPGVGGTVMAVPSMRTSTGASKSSRCEARGMSSRNRVTFVVVISIDAGRRA